MPLRFSVPTPLEYFATLVEDDDGFPLLEAAASIAQDEYPGLDVQQLLGDVDRLLGRLKRRLPPDTAALQRLRLLNHFLYAELGFGGNANNYYDPENSYLNDVLLTRRGIPISLGVLWMELAQGIGLHVRGVAFPGHFLVKALLPKGQVLIDPLTGKSLSRKELAERLVPFQPDAGPHGLEDVPLGLYLQAAPARDILARMLRNLKEIHRTHQDWLRLIAVQNRLIVLLPEVWSEWRDRGLAHAECGNAANAVADLETYLAHAPGERDADAIAEQVSVLRSASG